ncbi:MAG: hypothetical protein NT091_05375, partial [Candidatus Falkowbacteria bacterium]|nr:hypothetical protein [Candidatus Falkowbacteria bacterium]
MFILLMARAFDSPQTLATGISALAVYNNKLYIGQGFNSPYGDVYVYDGATWSLSYNGTSLSIWSFAVYNNKLYAGRGNGAAGDDDVLVFDGTSWSVNYNGWTSLNVMALATYNGKLYAGLGTAANAGDVWEYNGTTWSISYDSANTAIPSLVVYNG